MTVVPFRRRPLEQPPVWNDGRVHSHCDEHVHVFASVPGRCQCGECLWDTTNPPDVAGHLKEAGDRSDEC